MGWKGGAARSPAPTSQSRHVIAALNDFPGPPHPHNAPQTFKGSPLVQRLQQCDAASREALATHPWPGHLVGYLLLEQRCMRWYAAARAFFAAHAEQACAPLQGPAGGAAGAWAAFLASLELRQAEVERAVYAMPAGGDPHAACHVPPLFQAYAGDLEVDVIDLCD